MVHKFFQSLSSVVQDFLAHDPESCSSFLVQRAIKCKIVIIELILVLVHNLNLCGILK